jgi:hypothetical protein
MRILLVPASCALLLLLSACATNQRSTSLSTTLNAYGAALRWGGFAQAQQFVDPDYRAAHPLTDLEKERYKQVRVSDYDAGNGPTPVDPNTVRQVVRISLINRNTQRERSVIDRQTWTYNAKTQHWWLQSGLPDITRGH